PVHLLFFFQAEDGIRDFHVTGVQTCALPICDGLGEDVPLHRVRRQQHDELGLLAGLRGRDHAQPLLGGAGAAAGALRQPHPDVHTGVTQRQGVGVTLAPVADHPHRAGGHQGQVRVVLVVHLGGHGSLSPRSSGTGSWSVRSGRWGQAAARRAGPAVIDREPRPIATMPDWTISRMPNGSRSRSNASSLSAVPVASIVSVSGDTSTTRARNSRTVSSTCDRTGRSARTLTSSSSRCTATSGSSSTTLSTLTSLLSCLVTCSSGRSAALTTMVIREIPRCSVSPTASESMLKPRRENSPATRASTPGLFSTSTDSVCLLIAVPSGVVVVEDGAHAPGVH